MLAEQRQRVIEELEGKPVSIMEIDQVSAYKWRFMYRRPDGECDWATADELDRDLLTRCGCPPFVWDGNYRFPRAIEPTVLMRFSDRRVCWVIESVFHRERGFYVDHEQAKGLRMSQLASVQTDDMIRSIERVMRQKIDQLRKERRDQRDAEGREHPTGDEQIKEEAQIVFDSILWYDEQQAKYGQIMLRAMWEMRTSMLYIKLGGAESISDVIRTNKHMFKNPNYASDMARICDRVFPEVHAMAQRGTPFLNPETGEKITVDYLIASTGLIRKLKESSDHYSKLISIEDKRSLMGALVTSSSTKLEAVREKQQQITVATQLVIRMEDIEGDTEKGRLVIEGDQNTLQAAIRLLKPLGEVNS